MGARVVGRAARHRNRGRARVPGGDDRGSVTLARGVGQVTRPRPRGLSPGVGAPAPTLPQVGRSLFAIRFRTARGSLCTRHVETEAGVQSERVAIAAEGGRVTRVGKKYLPPGKLRSVIIMNRTRAAMRKTKGYKEFAASQVRLSASNGASYHKKRMAVQRARRAAERTAAGLPRRWSKRSKTDDE